MSQLYCIRTRKWMRILNGKKADEAVQ